MNELEETIKGIWEGMTPTRIQENKKTKEYGDALTGYWAARMNSKGSRIFNSVTSITGISAYLLNDNSPEILGVTSGIILADSIIREGYAALQRKYNPFFEKGMLYFNMPVGSGFAEMYDLIKNKGR